MSELLTNIGLDLGILIAGLVTGYLWGRLGVAEMARQAKLIQDYLDGYGVPTRQRNGAKYSLFGRFSNFVGMTERERDALWKAKQEEE